MKGYIIAIVYFVSLFSCSNNVLEKEDSFESNPWISSFFRNDCSYIFVIGDIQEYTDPYKSYQSYYEATIDWIYQCYIQGVNVSCVLQTGDLTWGNKPSQYDIYYDITEKVSNNIPFISCIGNHDYTWNTSSEIEDRSSSLFTNYVSSHLLNNNIISSYEKEKIDNIIVSIKIGDKGINIISLEFSPRKEVVEWANKYIKDHSDDYFILLTHEFLSKNGERLSDANSYARQIINSSSSTPDYLWNNLIKDNNNLVGVICGHTGFSNHLLSENSYGKTIPQILFNLQNMPNGGDGLLEVLEFSPQNDSVRINVINTINNCFFTDSITELYNYHYTKYCVPMDLSCIN